MPQPERQSLSDEDGLPEWTVAAPECLAHLQDTFLSAVYESPEPATALVRSDNPNAALERLRIYRGSVFGNLTQSLAGVFPVLRQSVGDTFFDAMIARFIKAHPPSEFGLEHYGANLPEFVAAFEPLAGYPYLPDLVRLEWARHRAFHALDESPLNIHDLANLSPETQMNTELCRLQSVLLIASDFAIDTVWSAHQADSESGPDSHGMTWQEPVNLVVWKGGGEVWIRRVTAVTAFLLGNAQQTVSLETLLARVSEAFPETDLGQVLAEALANGWLVAVTA